MQKPIFIVVIAAIAATLAACAGLERETRALAEIRALRLEIHRIDDTPGALEKALVVGIVPDDSALYPGDDFSSPLLLKKQVEISSAHLEDAQLAFSAMQEIAINLRLNAEGQGLFCEFTRQHIGERVAVLLVEEGKREVWVTPFIRGEICAGNLQIAGAGMSVNKVHQIAQRLRAGISAGK